MDKAMLYEIKEMAPTGAQYVQVSYGRPCGVYYRAVNDQVEMANSAGFFSWQPAYFSALDLSKMLCKGDIIALPTIDQPEVTEAEEEEWQRMDKEQSRQQYSAYYKDVRHIEYIDVYRTVDLFGCESTDTLSAMRQRNYCSQGPGQAASTLKRMFGKPLIACTAG